MKTRSIIGYGLGFLGVLWVLATLALHAWLDYRGKGEPSHLLYASLVAGAVIGWWGFYWADSRRSLEGGGFLVSAAERLRPVRTGRRESDAVTLVADPVIPPTPAHLPDPIVTEEHDA